MATTGVASAESTRSLRDQGAAQPPLFLCGGSNRGSTQLAVLAAAPVIKAVGLHLLVGFGLAGDAQAHARQGFAPRLGDLVAALFAGLAALAHGKTPAHALERVLDAGIY